MYFFIRVDDYIIPPYTPLRSIWGNLEKVAIKSDELFDSPKRHHRKRARPATLAMPLTGRSRASGRSPLQVGNLEIWHPLRHAWCGVFCGVWFCGCVVFVYLIPVCGVAKKSLDVMSRLFFTSFIIYSLSFLYLANHNSCIGDSLLNLCVVYLSRMQTSRTDHSPHARDTAVCTQNRHHILRKCKKLYSTFS